LAQKGSKLGLLGACTLHRHDILACEQLKFLSGLSKHFLEVQYAVESSHIDSGGAVW